MSGINYVDLPTKYVPNKCFDKAQRQVLIQSFIDL